MKHPLPETITQIPTSTPDSLQEVWDIIERIPAEDGGKLAAYTAVEKTWKYAVESLNCKKEYIPLYRQMANTLIAINNCQKEVDAGEKNPGHMAHWSRWVGNHKRVLNWLCENYLPSGSGFDCGTGYNWRELRASQSNGTLGGTLNLATSYHHMDEMGGYSHWSEHLITITPSLAHGFDMQTTEDGQDEEFIAYLEEMVGEALERKEYWNSLPGYKECCSFAENGLI